MDTLADRDLIEALGSLPPGAVLLARLPHELEPAVHLVGGSVRDLLRGGAPSDLDLVVEGPAGPLAQLLGGSAHAHDRFGTSKVMAEGFVYDIAGARSERYARPGALPDVEAAGLDQDLLRRDFTVNAIALALTGPDRGAVQAAPGALDDLDRGLLRVLHAASFTDDPTRLFRLARYAARLGFSADPGTEELARDAVQTGALATISGARVGNELRLLAAEADPVAALVALRPLRLDAAVAAGFGIEEVAVAQRALALLGSAGRRDLLALALASRAVAHTSLTELLDELAFEAVQREAIVSAAAGADGLAASLGLASRPSEIAAAVADARPEAVALAGALGPEAQAREWLDELRHVRLEIDGSDLLSAGIAQGPAVGAGLRAALAAELDERGLGHERQLEAALRAAQALES